MEFLESSVIALVFFLVSSPTSMCIIRYLLAASISFPFCSLLEGPIPAWLYRIESLFPVRPFLCFFHCKFVNSDKR